MIIIDHPSQQVGHYDHVASLWQNKMTRLGYAAAYRDAVATLLPWHLPSQRVMDVGCGAGDFAAAFAANRGPIAILTLADPAIAMLSAAKARLSRSARQLSAQARPIESLLAVPRQDVILCAHVIEHCADPAAALRRLGSILSPAGSILLVVSKPHWCNWLIWLRWRHHSFSRAEVLALIAVAGLCCTADMAFSRGPPSRTSHAYRINLPQGEPTC
jgi:2-polyprenyl-3-methyl-5-hydroxy-6-metoxy-1,4-benzoquinol methylase